MGETQAWNTKISLFSKEMVVALLGSLGTEIGTKPPRELRARGRKAIDFRGFLFLVNINVT